MMPALLLLIGGATIAMALWPDDVFQDEEYVPDTPDELDQSETSMFDFISDSESDPSLKEMEPDTSLEQAASSENSFPQGPENEIEDKDEDVSIQLSSQDMNDLPNALADWSAQDEILAVELGKGETLTISTPQDVRGSLLVLDANYVEVGTVSAGHSVTEYVGLNIYFIPEGETFPEDYDWSPEGAMLVNTDTYESNAEDFGEIKLLGRINSGSWTVEYQENGIPVITNDERMGEPEILSDLVIR